jgi:hypothetical protein
MHRDASDCVLMDAKIVYHVARKHVCDSASKNGCNLMASMI